MKRQWFVTAVLTAAIVAGTSGQQLDTIIFLPDTLGGLSYPRQFIANPLTGMVYVRNDLGPVLGFDPASRQKARFFRGGFSWAGFLPGVDKVYLQLIDPVGLVVVDARADTILRTVSLGEDYQTYGRFAWSRTSNKLYLPLEDTGLAVFDPVGDTVLATLTDVESPMDVVWDSIHDRVFVGHQFPQVSVVDCVRDSLLAVLSTDDPLWLLTVSAERRKVYCGGWDAIHVIDTDSLAFIESIPFRAVLDEDMLVPMEYNRWNGRLYAVGMLGADIGVGIIDCEADTLRAFIPLPSPASLAVSPFTGRVYAGCGQGVAVIDDGDTIVDRLFAGSPWQFTGMGVFPERGELYCGMDRDSVGIVDCRADTVLGHVPCESYFVRSMAFNPAGRKLYLLCPTQDVVLVLGPDYRILKKITGGVYDRDARPVLNPALNRLYVADKRMLHVIDCNTDSLVGLHPMAGIKDPIPVLQPELSKLYVFPKDATSGSRLIWVYDCLRDSFVRTIALTDETPCAAYDSRSNRIWFGCKDAPSVRCLDPLRDTVVRTFGLAGKSDEGRMLANTDQGRLYYTDQSPRRLYTIDVLADSVLDSTNLGWNIDTLFWNRRLGKLYLCGASSALAFDCRRNSVIDTIAVSLLGTGVMNERNDKLYLGSGAVVDCRYDSVVTVLPTPNPHAMAWNQVDNLVYAARENRLYVYRDDLTGVIGGAVAVSGFGLALVRNPSRGGALLRCQVPRGETGTLTFIDVAGRRVAQLPVTGRGQTVVVWPGRDEQGRRVAAGVYFGRLECRGRTETVKVVME